jgi:hypothetical protein
MTKTLPLTPDAADAIALEGLTYLASNMEMLEGFCLESGLLLNDLRERLTDRLVLGAILDYILSEQARFNSFCEISGHRPETLVKARITMPGFSPEMRTVENF